MTEYAFRAMTADDLPLLRTWLKAPEVTTWWGEPDEQYALVAEDIGNHLMSPLIVLADDTPFAYAQHYEAHAWPQPHLASLPIGARAVDAFVGEPTMLGRGHGARFLHALASSILRDGAPMVVIDPDCDNARARRAYYNAGFRGDTIVESGEGPAVLMIFDPKAAAAKP